MVPRDSRRRGWTRIRAHPAAFSHWPIIGGKHAPCTPERAPRVGIAGRATGLPAKQMEWTDTKTPPNATPGGLHGDQEFAFLVN